MIRQALQVLASQQKVDSLKKKNPELADDIQTLADSDPSGNKKHTYLQWAVNKLKVGDEVNELVEAVESFHKAKGLLEIKDLNQYKTPREVLDKSKAVLKAEEDAKDSELVYSEGGVEIYRVYTKKQMCEVGKNSKWCVSHPGGIYWDDYYTKPTGWEFYVLDVKGKKYLAYLVGGELREYRNWSNDEDYTGSEYLGKAGILPEDEKRAWPKWLQDADTENAVVTVTASRLVTWHSGTWKSGTWRGGAWEDGTWLGGVWKRGTWHDGFWRDGAWESGVWRDGTWKSGVWEDGEWVKGSQWDSETRNFEDTLEPPSSHQVKSSLAARVLAAVGAK